MGFWGSRTVSVASGEEDVAHLPAGNTGHTKDESIHIRCQDNINKAMLTQCCQLGLGLGWSLCDAFSSSTSRCDHEIHVVPHATEIQKC